MEWWCSKNKCRFVISSGDNFYPSGVESSDDVHFSRSFERVYGHKSLLSRIPWYISLGNHDYMGDVSAQIEYSRHNPTWNMPSRQYTFLLNSSHIREIPIARFTVIDTTPWIEMYRNKSKINQLNMPWSVAEARRSTEDELLDGRMSMRYAIGKVWWFVVGHHPIKTMRTAPRGDETDMELLGSMLNEQHPSPDFYIAGHDHSLQVIRSSTQRTVHVTSGAGSRIGKNIMTLIPRDESAVDRCEPGEVGDVAFATNQTRGFVGFKVTRDFVRIEVVSDSAKIIHCDVILRY